MALVLESLYGGPRRFIVSLFSLEDFTGNRALTVENYKNLISVSFFPLKLIWITVYFRLANLFPSILFKFLLFFLFISFLLIFLTLNYLALSLSLEKLLWLKDYYVFDTFL